MLADVSGHENERTGRGQRRGGRVPWAVVLLALAAVTSSSLSALSLYHVLALQAEVEGLRSEVNRRREERWGGPAETPQQQSSTGEDWTQVRGNESDSQTVVEFCKKLRLNVKCMYSNKKCAFCWLLV